MIKSPRLYRGLFDLIFLSVLYVLASSVGALDNSIIEKAAEVSAVFRNIFLVESFAFCGFLGSKLDTCLFLACELVYSVKLFLFHFFTLFTNADAELELEVIEHLA